MRENLKARLKKIKCIVCDVDGVLTKGDICLDVNGDELKTFCAKDAPRIKAAQENGIKIIFFTGRKNPATEHRAKELKVDLYYKKDLKEKAESLLEKLKELYNVEQDEIAYIGDDWNDLYYMIHAAVAVAPADATYENKKVPNVIVTKAKGGQGVVSEFIIQVLEAQGVLQKTVESYYTIYSKEN